MRRPLPPRTTFVSSDEPRWPSRQLKICSPAHGRSLATNAVCLPDFRDFKASIENMPQQLPATAVDASWQHILEKKTVNMRYAAWRQTMPVRRPALAAAGRTSSDLPPHPCRQSGHAEYLSVTVLEGRTPEELFAFFNADAHRMTWCAPQRHSCNPCTNAPIQLVA